MPLKRIEGFKLYKKGLRYRTKHCALVTNGVDVDHFRRNVCLSVYRVPKEITPLVNKRKPIIGYYGSLTSWFNDDLVMKLCQKGPDYEILLIGYGDRNSLARRDFRQYPFIHDRSRGLWKITGVCFLVDVATIPLKLNEITESTSSIKLFEYIWPWPPHRNDRYAEI
jgi:hypothetical protein